MQGTGNAVWGYVGPVAEGPPPDVQAIHHAGPALCDASLGSLHVGNLGVEIGEVNTVGYQHDNGTVQDFAY